jgi:AcrR family transcriptional regulator
MAAPSSAPATPPRRIQPRGQATRERVLSAAEALFRESGYQSASMSDVARRAGVGVGTLYHHFADKRALLLELIERIGDRVAAQRKGELALEAFLGEDPRAAIGRWLERAHARLRSRPSLYLVMLDLAARDLEVARRYRRIEEVAISRLAELIELAQRRGLARPGLDPATAAFLVHHSVDMAAMQLFLRGDHAPDSQRILSELTDMICRYLLEERR